jgi:hypothetical protein
VKGPSGRYGGDSKAESLTQVPLGKDGGLGGLGLAEDARLTWTLACLGTLQPGLMFVTKANLEHTVGVHAVKLFC